MAKKEDDSEIAQAKDKNRERKERTLIILAGLAAVSAVTLAVTFAASAVVGAFNWLRGVFSL